jgi:hypothetical protein
MGDSFLVRLFRFQREKGHPIFLGKVLEQI